MEKMQKVPKLPGEFPLRGNLSCFQNVSNQLAQWMYRRKGSEWKRSTDAATLNSERVIAEHF